MSARRIMLIVVALLITVGTAAVARNWVNSRQAVVQAPIPVAVPKKGPMVLVAQTDIPTGVFVQPNYLRWTSWPDDIIPENYFTNDLFATLALFKRLSRIAKVHHKVKCRLPRCDVPQRQRKLANSLM